MANVQSQSDISLAAAWIDDACMLSYIVEKFDNGLLVVLAPRAPTPATGSFYYLTEHRVTRLDLTVSMAIKCTTQLGLGSRELLQGYPNLEREMGATGFRQRRCW